ncbi:hypothetical protein BpHYR1_020911 [Brachionus plicatilis]|uniref:Uncharacterized protein n=1 Tax=Brachionus plicatilis TaxID=10195 RepID=A0A3M7REE4_BRAPC|nr:hypothetical protein BpHYR1_020911 [Brachionus plicatilis]
MSCIDDLKCVLILKKFIMSKRISAQKALELMKTGDYTQSFVGDVYNEEEDEEDEVEMHIEEAIEATIQKVNDNSNFDKTGKVEKFGLDIIISGFINPTVLSLMRWYKLV